MGILEANADSLRLAAEAPQPAPTPDPPGMFHNFWSSAGNYAMRGMAEAGRALSMAGAVVPIVADKLIGSDNRGEALTDRYFKAHDDYFGAAVDYWTPKPEEVGAAGQITGSLASGIVQFLANPALVVGTSMLSTSEDLVRKGIPADAALVAGDVAGLATAAGIALPIFGKGLASRVATGAGGNLATNIPQAAITQQIVTAAGKPELAQDFNPWDVRARTVDVLLGAVFGAKAHFDARVRDAVMATNAARHIESASLPVRGADDAQLTQAVDSTRLAIDQMSRGEVVNVPEQIRPHPTETPEFKAWFGDSKVVGEDGAPLVVYHGTTADIAEMKSRADLVGADWMAGMYFARDPDYASQYTYRTGPGTADYTGGNVMPVYLSMKNPKSVEDSLGSTAISRAEVAELKAQGYDGIINKAGDEYIIFDPQQAKSAIGNSGRFDPNSASLTDPLEAYGADMARLIDDAAPKATGAPIARPDMTATLDTPQAPQFPDSLKLPTDEFDPATGAPKYITATEAIAKAQTDAADVKTRAADFMRVAATCLLGGV